MARYMRTDLGRGHTNLRAPVVVGAGIAWHGPGVYLTYPNRVQDQAGRRRIHSALRPPAVVTQPVVETFSGPRTHLTQPRRTGPFHSTLRPPAVIGAGRVNPGLRIKLTFGQSRRGSAQLFPPAVVTAAVTEVFSGPSTLLAPSRRPVTRSRLSQFIPEAAVAEISYGPSVTLTRIRPPRVYSDLGAPIVVDTNAALGWIGIQLAPQRRGQAKSFLGEPIVAPAVVQVYYGPEITLTRRRTPAVRSVLRPPVIPPVARPIEITLAPQRRGAPHSFLQPPRVVFLAVEIYGPEVSLARITPAPVFSVLRPPTVLAAVVADVFYGPQITLAYSRRPLTRSALRAPAVVGAGRVNPGLRIKLVFGQRGVAKSRLFPPSTLVVAAQTYYGPQVTLAPQRRGTPTSFLRPPTAVTPAVLVTYAVSVTLAPSHKGKTLSQLGRPVVIEQPQGPQGGVLVSLAPQRRGRAKSLLKPPAVVTPIVVVYYGPQVTLAPQRRGRPKSILRAPRVLAQAPAYQPTVPPTFAPQRRGRPTYFLSPPTRVFPFFARKTDITLAPQRRGAPHSFLLPPRVVRLAVEIYGPETWLTYSRRGRPQYRLEPPAVVGRAPFRGIKTWLTRIKPRPTVALLRTPVVVRVPTAGQLQVHLTYSRRGRPISFRLPEVVGIAPHRPIQVHLTRITPPPVVYFLEPPSVVGAGIAFFGPSVTLVRITPPPVISFLKLTLVAFRRPGGDVCGFDIATTFVCFIELPGSQVSGTDAPTAQISGSSRAGSTMTGSDSAGSGVSGSDRKAT